MKYNITHKQGHVYVIIPGIGKFGTKISDNVLENYMIQTSYCHILFEY